MRTRNTYISPSKRVLSLILCFTVVAIALVLLLGPTPSVQAANIGSRHYIANPATFVVSGGNKIIFAANKTGPHAATWTCGLQAYGAKLTSNSFWGLGWMDCSQSLETIDMTVYAIYCQPVLWGCLWFVQGQMGKGCTYNNISANTSYWCPAQKYYTWSKNVDPGELWGVRVQGSAYGSDGSAATDTVDLDIQF